VKSNEQATMFYTHTDIEPLQAGEAFEEVNHCIQIRASRVKNQNPHGMHFGCQANSDHFQLKCKTSRNKNNSLNIAMLSVQWMKAAAT
jgi:hypothetical protein